MLALDSPVPERPEEQRNQRDSKGDWQKVQGQGRCKRTAEAEGTTAKRKGRAYCSIQGKRSRLERKA